MDILEGLNNEQLEAVTSTEGYVRVIAGAGSGKTKTLTHRYAYLVKELGISTSNIACVTFTNKAATEMKTRIRGMIGDYDIGYICTFHGLGLQILREDIHVIGYPSNFVVLDGEDTEAILKKVYEDCNITSENITFDAARKAIQSYKHDPMRSYSYICYLADLDNKGLKEAYKNEKIVTEKIILGYIYEQKKNYGLDFDDLICLPLYIFRTNREKCEKWQKRMMYVMVDEFQDVSRPNYDLVDILSQYHKNLFVVGDPDQTIYSWRGAKMRFILDFDKKYADTKTIKLNQNYRSTPEILGASNSLIKNNTNRIPNELIAVKKSNKAPVYNHLKTVQDEASWIVRNIKNLMSNGAKAGDIAVLYRAHYVSRSLEEKLIKEKIPYTLYSGVEFYKRKEIKDVLSYLRMLVQGDDLAFLRVVNEPKRNIGKKRIAFLTEYAEEYDSSLYDALKANLDNDLFNMDSSASEFVELIETYRERCEKEKLSDVFTGILNDSGYENMLRLTGDEERLENLAELKQSVFEFEKSSGEGTSLGDYLQSIALFTNGDRTNKQDSVKLMTIHTAKGLEFPYVFLCEMNEGLFPSKHANSLEVLEEERRLAYVAYTRAEKGLFITDAQGLSPDNLFRYPSRFIFNTNKKYLEYETDLDEEFIKAAEKYIAYKESMLEKPAVEEQTDYYKVGDRVRHKVFGQGKIIDIETDTNTYVIKFDEIETERKFSFKAPWKRK